MIRGLLVSAAPLAAIILAAAPAQAERWSDSNFGAAAGVSIHRGDGGDRRDRGFTGRVHDGSRFTRDFCDDRSRRDFRRGRDDDDDRRGRDRRRDRRDCFFGGGFGYYGDYDANRSFDPDLWNDWWHERRYRSYPAWVARNKNCAPDRMWWSGAGWHC
jgi:hypothetical protein